MLGFTKLYVVGSSVACQLVQPGGMSCSVPFSPYPLRYLPMNIVS